MPDFIDHAVRVSDDGRGVPFFLEREDDYRQEHEKPARPPPGGVGHAEKRVDNDRQNSSRVAVDDEVISLTFHEVLSGCLYHLRDEV